MIEKARKSEAADIAHPEYIQRMVKVTQPHDILTPLALTPLHYYHYIIPHRVTAV